MDNMTILELYNIKELIVLRSAIESRRDAVALDSTRQAVIEYLALCQILARLPQVPVLEESKV